MDGSAILARLRARLGARALDAHERFGDHTLVVPSPTVGATPS